jgi:hypothetical protein
MAVVKSVRLVAAKAGSVLDQEDRKLLGQAGVISVALIWGAAVLGLMVRVFAIAMGG